MEDTPPVGNTIIESDAPSAAVTENSPVWRPPKSRVDRVAEEAALVYLRCKKPSEALKLLMKAYGARIRAFALRIVRNRELARDVSQDVFLDAFRGFDKFEGRCTLWSWLCSIAYHRCLDELRRLRRARAGDDLVVRDDRAGYLDPMMDADRGAMRRALEKCLGQLPPAMRSQLLMRHHLGLTYAELGKIVGAMDSTVQVRISRILPLLRKCLRGEGFTR